jgi:hypothetical protein
VGRNRNQQDKPKQPAKPDKPTIPVNETARDAILAVGPPVPSPPPAEPSKPPTNNPESTVPGWQKLVNVVTIVLSVAAL